MGVRKTIESQTFLTLTVPLCIILSLVIIGLVGHNLDYATSRSARTDWALIRWNVTVNDTELIQNKRVDYLPQDLRLGSYWLMLAAGIIGFIDSIALAAMLLWRKANVWRAENRSGMVQDINRWPQTPIAVFLAVFGFLFSLAATIYAWVDWAASATFDPSDDIATVNGRYAAFQGFFTLDAWNCQFEDYIINSGDQDRIQNLCTEGTATRTVTLALCVLMFGVVLSVCYRVYLRANGGGQTRPFTGAGVFPPVDEERGRSRTRESEARTLPGGNEKEDMATRHSDATAPEKALG